MEISLPDTRTPGTQGKLSVADYWDRLTIPEKAYQRRMMAQLSRMRDQREQPLKEWDGLTYSQRYEINKEADLAFNTLVGDIDERDKGFNMRTGVTRAKDTSILSHVASFDFEASIVSYDKEKRIIVELGENTADLVKKSREMEQWDDKKYGIYRELIAQGNVFVEEEYTQVMRIHKDGEATDGTEWKPGRKINEYKQDDFPIVTLEGNCEANVLLGKYVYLGVLTQEDIQKQPIVATYREISGDEFTRVYGSWDRAEYVRATLTAGAQYHSTIDQIFNTGETTASSVGFGRWGSQYFWNMNNPGKNVGIVKIYQPFSNRYMLMANGIMLLPVDFPLTKISPSGLIPLAKGDAERITNFAYSKGIPANTYVDEKLYDFVYQAMAKKMMQSAEPTLANNTGREMPRNWAKPGVMYRGLKAAMIEPLLPQETRTITNADTSYFEIVKTVLNDKSVDDSFSGGNQPVGQTATVYLEQQKNTISKLFQMVDGIRSLERQLTRLRIANLYANWTKSEDKTIEKEVTDMVDGVPVITGVQKDVLKKYREVHVDTKIKDENTQGMKIIRFYDDTDLPSTQDHIDEEDELSDTFDKPVRIVYMHAPSLSRLFDYHWYIDIIPHDTNSSDIKLMAYLDAKQRVVNLFATDPTGVLDKDYTLSRIAEFQDEDSAKAYNTGGQMGGLPGQMVPSAPPGAPQGQMQLPAGAGGIPQPGQSPASDAMNGMKGITAPATMK